jgi:hypothetical protein
MNAANILLSKWAKQEVMHTGNYYVLSTPPNGQKNSYGLGARTGTFLHHIIESE